MAKRFIDTNLFKKKFIRDMKGPLKLLWIYLFCDCSNSGIWEIDLEVASIYVGSNVKMNDIQALSEKIVIFDEGRKLFIPDFIEFQYGTLNPNNPAHKNVVKELIKYQLIDENYNVILKGPLEDLQRDSKGDKDMDMDKDKVIYEKGGMGEKTWKDDFEQFKTEIWREYDSIIRDEKWIAEQERLNPGIDVPLSIEKSIKNFWATEAGWKNKKKSKAEKPNWRQTFAKTMGINKVYKPKGPAVHPTVLHRNTVPDDRF